MLKLEIYEDGYKPVYWINSENQSSMWEFEFQAVHGGALKWTCIASDSLINIKRAIKRLGWRCGWISAKSGSFSCGQHIVDEYPYCPRYYRQMRR